MKKYILGFILLLTVFAGLSFTNDIVSAAEPSENDSFTFEYSYNVNGVISSAGSVDNVLYGSAIDVDEGSQTGKTFVGFIKNDKYEPNLDASSSIIVTGDTDLEVLYKDSNSVAVILLDANQEFLGVWYADSENSNYLDTSVNSLPDINTYSKPGLTTNGWTDGSVSISDLSTHAFTSDSIVSINYDDPSEDDLSLNLINGTADVAGPYDFNQTITVTADDSGSTFNCWKKDGQIVSYQESYTFTFVSNHKLEAVYDEVGFVPIAGTDSFVSASRAFAGISAGYFTILGQFDLADGEELVEYGFILSDTNDTLDLDDDGVDSTVYFSNKYNPETNEFVMSFSEPAGDLPYYRAFVTTINNTGKSAIVTTTYSEVMTHTKLYFNNSDDWTNVYAYTWGTYDDTMGVYPGYLAVNEDSNDWWYLYVPVIDTDDKTSGLQYSYNLVFSNGLSGESEYKTKDIVIDESTGLFVTPDGSVYSDKSSAETGLESTRIWFYNEQNWGTVYYHMWYSSGVSDPDIPATDYNNPPTATQDGTSQWYYIDIDVNTSVTEIGVIFKNTQVGDGWKTGDILINTHTLVYVVGDDEPNGLLDIYLSYHKPL